MLVRGINGDFYTVMAFPLLSSSARLTRLSRATKKPRLRRYNPNPSQALYLMHSRKDQHDLRHRALPYPYHAY